VVVLGQKISQPTTLKRSAIRSFETAKHGRCDFVTNDCSLAGDENVVCGQDEWIRHTNLYCVDNTKPTARPSSKFHILLNEPEYLTLSNTVRAICQGNDISMHHLVRVDALKRVHVLCAALEISLYLHRSISAVTFHRRVDTLRTLSVFKTLKSSPSCWDKCQILNAIVAVTQVLKVQVVVVFVTDDPEECFGRWGEGEFEDIICICVTANAVFATVSACNCFCVEGCSANKVDSFSSPTNSNQVQPLHKKLKLTKNAMSSSVA
jgi:hypothetical protein